MYTMLVCLFFCESAWNRLANMFMYGICSVCCLRVGFCHKVFHHDQSSHQSGSLYSGAGFDPRHQLKLHVTCARAVRQVLTMPCSGPSCLTCLDAWTAKWYPTSCSMFFWFLSVFICFSIVFFFVFICFYLFFNCFFVFYRFLFVFQCFF